jgi:hypothetical protein
LDAGQISQKEAETIIREPKSAQAKVVKDTLEARAHTTPIEKKMVEPAPAGTTDGSAQNAPDFAQRVLKLTRDVCSLLRLISETELAPPLDPEIASNLTTAMHLVSEVAAKNAVRSN